MRYGNRQILRDLQDLCPHGKALSVGAIGKATQVKKRDAGSKFFRQKNEKILAYQKKFVSLQSENRGNFEQKTLQDSVFQGKMPEWSIGAVSKTVDQLAGPRVRIPVSPQMR